MGRRAGVEAAIAGMATGDPSLEEVLKAGRPDGSTPLGESGFGFRDTLMYRVDKGGRHNWSSHNACRGSVEVGP